MTSTESIDHLFEPVDVETVANAISEQAKGSKDASDGVDKGLGVKSVEFDWTNSKSKSSKKAKKTKGKKHKYT